LYTRNSRGSACTALASSVNPQTVAPISRFIVSMDHFPNVSSMIFMFCRRQAACKNSQGKERGNSGYGIDGRL
jgi:hypothetical protein